MRYIAFIPVIALLFCSCIGHDMEEDGFVNPTYDGSTIKAELAINVPVGNSVKPMGRMSAEAVQDKSVDPEHRFRGLQDIVLIPYKEKKEDNSDNLVSDGGVPEKMIACASSEFAAAPMLLSSFSSSNIENWYIDKTDRQMLGSSQVYSDVTIPIDTKHFVLYGRAMNNATDDDRYFCNGSLLAGDGSRSFQNYLLGQTSSMEDAGFTLRHVKVADYYSGENPTGELADAQRYLLQVLNNLLDVEVPARTEGGMTWPAMKWSEMGSDKVKGISDANILNVYGLYKSFILEGKDVLRQATAGSSNAVRLRLDALYRSALNYTRHQEEDGTYTVYRRVSGHQPVGAALDPILSSTMSYAIMDAITASVAPVGMAGICLFQFTTDGVTENFGWSSETAGKSWLTAFPAYFHLPDGTYQLAYNQSGSENRFCFTDFTIGPSAPANAQMLLDPRQICYPAELVYMGNSGLRERQGIDDTWRWPTTLEAWNNADGVLSEGVQKDYWPNNGSDLGWFDKAVNTATTAVALKDQVQYAVASLKVRVKCNSQVLTDNRNSYDPVAGDQQVPVPATGLRITGVLVGNQPDAVDWELMPSRKTNGSTFVDGDFSRIVYDRDVPADFYAPYTQSIGTCVPNFTLLLDNYNASADALESAVKVNVAIELENNTGVGFYGVNGGFIPVGAKFYVIGKMDVSDEGVTLNGTNHVFQKDYMTEANFTLTALKAAYNVIPDLRSAKLEFGLSVDIDWKSGALFDINVGDDPL